ncbi:MFS transporter [Rhodoferax sp.]|uniref:MFS transporter n=1 Tax=Rhodoferax sp. TaxID=50421 RepID=UPI00284D53F0|nr:MFS transporter [Rhodoferax sp.]MDR3369276.1 MFS transporter [Rhodoferax sp.]
MSAAAFAESFALLRTKKFGTFWFASFLSNIGTWAQQVAQPWLLLSLGASPFLLGLDSFALAAPVFLLTLIGGALADSADRRETILKFQTAQMLCPVLIVVILVTHTAQPWMIIGLSLVVGITDGLSMPSFQSIVPSIVERQQISNGLALNATQFNLSRILGPAIAGLLMTSVGAVGAFGVSALSYVPFILVVIWILPKGATSLVKTQRFAFSQMRTNVRHVVSQPLLRGALMTVFVSSVMCAPLVVFSPVLVKVSLNGDVSHFSLAVGSFGVGGLLGAVSLLALDEKRDRRRISSAFAIVYSLAVALASQSRSQWLLPVLFALAGYSMTMTNTSANTLLQSAASSTIRGQTVSLFMLVMRGGMALGALITGLSVTLLGVRDALLVNGILALSIQYVIARSWGKTGVTSD